MKGWKEEWIKHGSKEIKPYNGTFTYKVAAVEERANLPWNHWTVTQRQQSIYVDHFMTATLADEAWDWHI